MRQVVFTDGQYLAAASLNPVAVDAASGIAQNTWAWSQPGLIHPDALTFAVSGLNVTITTPPPFGVQFASGILSASLGTTNGSTSSSYTVSLSGLVPSSGSITAYLLAGYQQLSQTPTAIVGPPQGNPAFNPSFIPVTAFTELVDSIYITGSSGAANNTSTFELARVTLSAGATGINLTNLIYQNQVISAAFDRKQYTLVSTNTTLAASGASYIYTFTASGLTATLPVAAICNGYPFYFSNQLLASGYNTILINALAGQDHTFDIIKSNMRENVSTFVED